MVRQRCRRVSRPRRLGKRKRTPRANAQRLRSASSRARRAQEIPEGWEIVMSAYLMVSLHSQVLNNHPEQGVNKPTDPVVAKFPEHDWWDEGSGWKNLLNNLRLVIQPFIFFNLLKPWRAGLSSFTFIYWISNTNCIDESNARCYSRYLRI